MGTFHDRFATNFLAAALDWEVPERWKMAKWEHLVKSTSTQYLDMESLSKIICKLIKSKISYSEMEKEYHPEFEKVKTLWA